jgi:hypothetical protein
MLALAVSAGAASVKVPSGQPLEFMEAFWDRTDASEPLLRLRFLAPEIGRSRDFGDVEGDFRHLCREVGLPRMQGDQAGTLIVIALISRPLAFGTSDPGTIQYVEAFRAEGDDCVWVGL